MASKWEDLTGNVSFWTTEQVTLLSHVWPDLKAAADERVSFIENKHDTTYAGSETFPDFNADKSLFISSENSPNNATRINTNVYPGDCVDEDTIEDDITISSTADFPTNLSLSDVLDDLGYTGDTKCLHMEDTDDGSQPALSLTDWYIQWYEIMNLPVWYNRRRSTGIPAWLGDVGTQETAMTVDYRYNQDTDVFVSAEADFREPSFSGSGTDLYTPGDLNETAPWSTPQDVRDLCIQFFDDNAGASWSNGWNRLETIGTNLYELASTKSTGEVRINAAIERRRIRFKVNQEYRATSPNRYDVEKYFYGFYGYDFESATTYSDFGTGAVEDKSDLELLTADGSDWYYLEITSIDYDTESVLTVPATPVSGQTDNEHYYGLLKRFLTSDMASLTTNDASIMFKPNLTDGTGFEYYTPAP